MKASRSRGLGCHQLRGGEGVGGERGLRAPPGDSGKERRAGGGVDTGQAKAVWLLCRIRRQLIERSSVAGHQLVHVHASVTEWRMYKTQASSDDGLLCVVVVYLRKEHASVTVGSYDLGDQGIHGARQNLSGQKRCCSAC